MKLNQQNYLNWKGFAESHFYQYVIVVYDPKEAKHFPVYCKTLSECNNKCLHYHKKDMQIVEYVINIQTGEQMPYKGKRISYPMDTI